MRESIDSRFKWQVTSAADLLLRFFFFKKEFPEDSAVFVKCRPCEIESRLMTRGWASTFFFFTEMLILGAILPNRFIAHLNGIRLECADRLDMWQRGRLIFFRRNVGEMAARLMCDRFMCELSRCCVAKCRCNFGEMGGHLTFSY
jgi:hypothetical protein